MRQRRISRNEPGEDQWERALDACSMSEGTRDGDHGALSSEPKELKENSMSLEGGENLGRE